ncbi:hypothetical protein HYV88_06390 [Candidatus Woesearchaeota archaeon]|nr:hypothetical protein [Candidatus Woesearchaeota archaeon]
MIEPLICVYTDKGVRISASREYLVGQRLGLRGLYPDEVRNMVEERDGRLTRCQKEDIMTGVRDNCVGRC